MKRVLPIFKRRGGKSRAIRDVAGDQEQEGSSSTSFATEPSIGTAVQTTQPGPSTSPVAASSFPDGISVWHDCPDATVDICFVHGLTGNRESTWTAQGQSVPWPKTLLPSSLPNARLLTYGYDAYVVRKSVASTNRLIDHASNLLNDLCNSSSRPLIFVVHSLGGLICKEAILLSQNNPEPHLRGVFDRIIGVVFMGTPHRGAWMANWAYIPASALGLFKSSNKSLLATLETENQLLESIQAKFLSMVRGVREGGRSLEVTCFFEELPLPFAGHIVSKESAIIDGYTSISIHANHRDMVRFASADDAGFQRLLGELMRWERSVTSASKSQRPEGAATMSPANALKSGIQPCHYTPFLENKRFIGREDTLDQLRKIFFLNKSQRVAVVGLGGVGKTQVALKFTYWIREMKPEFSTFWVPVLSQASFQQAYAEIARKLPTSKSTDDEDPKEPVRRYLSSEDSGPWLLVVDNMDDMDMFFSIDQYLPTSESGLILFTTRSRDVAVSVAASDIIGLSEMSSEEAMGLLEKSLIQKNLLHDKVAAIKLLRELTFLPLAITQAAAYLNRNQVSITKYMGLLQATEQDTVSLMSREFYDNTRYINSQNAVATTWLVSFDQIRHSDRSAADLLSFMSHIEPKAIPRSILPPLESEDQMASAIGTLRGYAFIVERGDDMFDMHSLVHLSTRIWVRRQDQTASTTRDVIQYLRGIFPSDDYKNRSLWRQYLPHVLRALKEEGADIEERYDLQLQIGRCLQVDGRIEEAVRCIGECYEWRKAHLPKDSLDRLASQHALAVAYEADGQAKEAIELLEDVVVIKVNILAEDHPDRLASQHVLARLYRDNGQVKVAVELLERVVATRKRVLAEDHPDRLNSQHALAMAYKFNGQVKEAIELIEHVVAIEANTLAEDHLDRLNSQHALAMAYEANGQVKEAIELLEHVVAIKANTLTKDHPHRLASQHALAVAYRDNGQVKEAVKLLEYVVAIRETILTKDHPHRLASQHALAVAYRDNGQVKEAIKLLKYIVAIRETTLAKDHPHRLASQHVLAVAYKTNGQVKEAVELLEYVVAIEANILAKDHFSRLTSQHALAVAYKVNGQVKEAVGLLEHVVAIRETTLAKDHPDRLDSQHALAVAYEANGQVKEAVRLLDHVVAIRETTLVKDHPDRLASQRALKRLYRQTASE